MSTNSHHNRRGIREQRTGQIHSRWGATAPQGRNSGWKPAIYWREDDCGSALFYRRAHETKAARDVKITYKAKRAIDVAALHRDVERVVAAQADGTAAALYEQALVRTMFDRPTLRLRGIAP